MTATSFDPDESVTLADMDSIATSVAKSVRESIAANVEGLGCNCTRLTSSKTEHRPWIRECPVSIAAAIREGRL